MKSLRQYILPAVALGAFVCNAFPASAALVTYTQPMSGFTHDSDVVSAAFNTALGTPYTHISFLNANSNDGASYSPLVTFSTKQGTFGGSNTNLVNANGQEIGPYGTWDGILNISFNGDSVSAVGFGLVEFDSHPEFIRIYDTTDTLIGTFNDQLTDIFSLWGVVATGTERIARIEMDGNFFAIQDIEFSKTSQSPVPEPTTMLLFGAGLLGLAGIARRKEN